MIPVSKVRKPREFDTKVKVRGDAWLGSHPGARRPKDLWSPYRKVLDDGFRGLCGYAAMLDPTGGTVDHFLSWKTHPELAYDWTNYRFASEALNKSKGTADDSVLDPYKVGDGWFEIILPSLQLKITDRIPRHLRAKAEFTINRLKLRDGERVLRWRRTWYEMYENGQIDLAALERVAPLIAAAAVRANAAGQGAP
ncbi:MAG: hypothetical protein V2A73_19595 [Pseudomonadota bacterium]